MELFKNIIRTVSPFLAGAFWVLAALVFVAPPLCQMRQRKPSWNSLPTPPANRSPLQSLPKRRHVTTPPAAHPSGAGSCRATLRSWGPTLQSGLRPSGYLYCRPLRVRLPRQRKRDDRVTRPFGVFRMMSRCYGIRMAVLLRSEPKANWRTDGPLSMKSSPTALRSIGTDGA